MNIGLVGAGMMGSTLGKLWARAGHTVLFSSRNPGSLGELLQRIPGSRAGTVHDAVAFAEVIFLGVPYSAMPGLAGDLADGVKGKLVLDAGNIIPARDGSLVSHVRAAGTGSGGYTQGLLPGARVVKAFNTVHFRTLDERSDPSAPGLGVPLAGDDGAAVETAARLVKDAGFEPVVLPGGIAASARIDFGTPVWNSGMSGADLRKALGLT